MSPMSYLYRRARVMNNVRAKSLHLDDDSQRLRAYHIFQNKFHKRNSETVEQHAVLDTKNVEGEQRGGIRGGSNRTSPNANDTARTDKVSRVKRRSQILDQVLELNTSAPIVDFEHGSKTEIHESHFCTYSKDEVIAAGGKYSCAECKTKSRALKLDADEHGVDLY